MNQDHPHPSHLPDLDPTRAHRYIVDDDQLLIIEAAWYAELERRGVVTPRQQPVQTSNQQSRELLP
jgi:hypothetical protein